MYLWLTMTPYSTSNIFRQVVLIGLLPLSVLCISNAGMTQNVLDGVYVREQPTVQVRSNAQMNRLLHHNSWMYLAGHPTDGSPMLFDTVMVARYAAELKHPLRFDDCVFINPAKRFVHENFRDFPAQYKKGTGDEDRTKWPLKRHIKNFTLPHSLRFYIDTARLEIRPGHWGFFADSLLTAPPDIYLPPFHFRKFEVTNAEYREFVHWVRDSIARLWLSGADDSPFIGKIKWDDPEVSEILEEMYLRENKRFYTGKELDSRKLNYEKLDGAGGVNIINVYPDTVAWVRDFSFSYNEPMTTHYFWHPAYDGHPVVGVSYHQALAFLYWKSREHNRQLREKGIPYRVRYDLPTEAQWDMVATAGCKDKRPDVFPSTYGSVADDRWVTDLLLTQKQPITNEDSTIAKRNLYPRHAADTVVMFRYVRERDDLIIEHFRHGSMTVQFTMDGQFHTHKADISKLKRPHTLVLADLDPNGVSFMGSNVSEWLKDSYQENWKPIFELRQRMLATFGEPDARLTADIERYFNQRNSPEGRLVRGANWYDERHGSMFGKKVDGMRAKVFVHPNSSHCTLGFRYVVTVTPITASEP
jgi:formylglycine-generating enzyme required for sulfatase activity